MISELAFVDKNAKIGKNVTIEPFAYIAADVEIGDDCYIYAHASILNGTRMGKRNKIHQGAVLGTEPQDLHYTGDETHLIIGDDNDIRENVVISRATKKGDATRIGNNCHLMDGVHLCHDVQLGNWVIVGLHVIIAGGCRLDDCTIMSNGAILQQDVHVGQWSLVQSGCRLSKDVPPYIMVKGNPAVYHGVNALILKKNSFKEMDDRTLRHIMNAYLILYQANISAQDAAMRIKSEIPSSPEIEEIVNFITTSTHLL